MPLKTLLLDLDETLVHSFFQPIHPYDYELQVPFENQQVSVYVLVRPHVKEFLKEMSQYYEIVYFTASIQDYANQVLDLIDPEKLGKHRLYRQACEIVDGSYIKNLSLLNRDLESTVIIDNSPIAYSMHPFNAIPIKSWYSDP